MEDIEIGDTVQLISGGPIMTVGQTFPETKEILCNWFNKDGKLEEAIFLKDALKKVDIPKRSPYKNPWL